MRMFLLSDNIDTQIGIRLAGIEGVVVHEKRELTDALEAVQKDNTVCIVLITEKLAALIPNEIKTIKLEKNSQLLVVIPDRHGTIRPEDSITAYVREAVGLKI